jgi:hypothetical protein
MARLSKKGGWIILAVLVLLLFVALNPSGDDFAAWLSAQAQDSVAAGGSIGEIKSGTGTIEKARTSYGGNRRSNYYLFSAYRLGDERYLGVLHTFIKLK